MRVSDLIASVAAASPAGIDLTNASQLSAVDDLMARLLDAYPDASALADLERELMGRGAEVPLMLHLATKNAKSTALLCALDKPTHVSVVFAMYKEHERMQRPSDHALGENFLVRKTEQLSRLFGADPRHTWELLAVDDGCPEGSGRIAREIVTREGLEEHLQILLLEEAIAAGLPVTAPMKSAAESQKGGAIAYGMWKAAQTERDHHVVIFTDADLSTHLGQTGLLLAPLADPATSVAIGSRRETASVVVKQGVRNARGKLFIYLWKRLLSPLSYIVDTQCGFKAFRAETIRQIAGDLSEKRFAVDLELLLRAELLNDNAIAKVGIAWIDSEAASTTTDLQPYLPMLKSVVGMYRRHLPPNAEAEGFAQLIDGLDEKRWQALLENIPGAIEDGDPQAFHQAALISADALSQAAGATST